MEKAFDINMIADFVPTLTGYLPVTLYILTLSLLFGFVLGLFLRAPHLQHSYCKSIGKSVYLIFQGTPIMVRFSSCFMESRR